MKNWKWLRKVENESISWMSYIKNKLVLWLSYKKRLFGFACSLIIAPLLLQIFGALTGIYLFEIDYGNGSQKPSQDFDYGTLMTIALAILAYISAVRLAMIGIIRNGDDISKKIIKTQLVFLIAPEVNLIFSSLLFFFHSYRISIAFSEWVKASLACLTMEVALAAFIGALFYLAGFHLFAIGYTICKFFKTDSEKGDPPHSEKSVQSQAPSEGSEITKTEETIDGH